MSKNKEKRKNLPVGGSYPVMHGGTHPDEMTNIAIPMTTIEIPEKVFGVRDTSEIKSALDAAMSSLYDLKTAITTNAPVNVAQAAKVLSDKMSLLEGVINTLG